MRNEPLQCSVELDSVLADQINSTPLTIYDELARRTGLSRSLVKAAAKKGALWLAPRKDSKFRRVRRLREVRVGECYALNYHPAILSEICAPPQLVEDCGAYSVWDKPAGMLSQPTRWADHNSVCRAVERQLGDGRQAFLVHRLDKMTSGLIVVSHQHAVTRELASAFERRSVQKGYSCIVLCRPDEILPQTIATDLDGKNALTVVKSVEPAAKLLNLSKVSAKPSGLAEVLSQCSLLTVSIETGRKHQIRRHLSSIGANVLGDRYYGSESQTSRIGVDLQLRAVFLQISCPNQVEDRCWKI